MAKLSYNIVSWVLTTVTTSAYAIGNVTFPAFTICGQERYSRNLLQDFLFGPQSPTFREFLNFFFELEKHNSGPFSSKTTMIHPFSFNKKVSKNNNFV